MIRSIEVVRSRGKIIALAVVGLILVSVGAYLVFRFMENRQSQAQQQLARGLDLYHAQLDPEALDDPYGKGQDPVFRSDEAKYKAASKEFSAVIEKYGSTKAGVIAQYYLGLCQLELNQKDAAVKSLEAVRNNTKDRTIGYLGKKVLAKHFMAEGNYKGAQEILEGMIKDPQCELPKEELKLQMARTYLAQGKRDEAIKTLREARDSAVGSSLQPLVTQELDRLGSGSDGQQD
jgi:predicted negative regulator of RcsB-dependent stress response